MLGAEKILIYHFAFDVSLPDDWKTPLRYTLITMAQFSMIAYIIVALLCIIVLYIGVCKFLTTLSLDIRNNLNEINTRVESYATIMAADNFELKTQWNNALKFHSDSLK